MNIKFAANAQRDIARANEWRVKNRPDAATAVVDEIDAALSLLAEQPESAAAFGTWRGRVVRRHYLPETRRQLYYAVVDDTLFVLRVVGAERGTQPRLEKKTSLS